MIKTLPTKEVQTLFDALPDVVFFAKDREGRYTHANLTLMRRLGKKRREDVIGRSTIDLFPLSLGGTYLLQDRRVLTGEVVENQLEVHLYPNRFPGWCLTFKYPIYARDEIIGLIGISRDLGPPGRHSSFARLNQVMDHVNAHFAEPIRVQTLADIAELSVAQLERVFRRVFQVTPQQMITKLRIESAIRLLHTDATVAHIGQVCGFNDQSAFARQFRVVVGITPRDYRSMFVKSAPPDIEDFTGTFL